MARWAFHGSRWAAGAFLVGGVTLACIAQAGDKLPPHGTPSVQLFDIKGTDIPKIVVKAVIHQPPKKVWQVVSDCSKYKARMPHTAAAKLIKTEGNKFTCEVTIAMPFPFSNLTSVTEAVNEESASGYVRRWKLVSGDFNFNQGSWEVKPLDAAGTKSVVTYTVHADPKTFVPNWLREMVQKKALPDLMERVESEAGKL